MYKRSTNMITFKELKKYDIVAVLKLYNAERPNKTSGNI